MICRGSLRNNYNGANTAIGGNSRDNTGADWQVGMMMSLPLGNDKARAMRQRADAEWRAAEAELARSKDQVVAETRVALRSVQLAAREIPAAERAATAARRVIEGERARLELNRIGNPVFFARARFVGGGGAQPRGRAGASPAGPDVIGQGPRNPPGAPRRGP